MEGVEYLRKKFMHFINSSPHPPPPGEDGTPPCVGRFACYEFDYLFFLGGEISNPFSRSSAPPRHSNRFIRKRKTWNISLLILFWLKDQMRCNFNLSLTFPIPESRNCLFFHFRTSYNIQRAAEMAATSVFIPKINVKIYYCTPALHGTRTLAALHILPGVSSSSILFSLRRWSGTNWTPGSKSRLTDCLERAEFRTPHSARTAFTHSVKSWKRPWSTDKQYTHTYIITFVDYGKAFETPIREYMSRVLDERGSLKNAWKRRILHGSSTKRDSPPPPLQSRSLFNCTRHQILIYYIGKKRKVAPR